MSEQLCTESNCPACGSPCQCQQDHRGQHQCINCGTRWWDEEEAGAKGDRPALSQRVRNTIHNTLKDVESGHYSVEDATELLFSDWQAALDHVRGTKHE